jgi:hypothetical protein
MSGKYIEAKSGTSVCQRLLFLIGFAEGSGEFGTVTEKIYS